MLVNIPFVPYGLGLFLLEGFATRCLAWRRRSVRCQPASTIWTKRWPLWDRLPFISTEDSNGFKKRIGDMYIYIYASRWPYDAIWYYALTSVWLHKKTFGKFILWLENCWNQPPTGFLKRTCLPILVVITRPEKLEGLAKTTVCIHKFDVCVCLSLAGKGFGISWNHTVAWLKSGEPVELGFANSHEKKNTGFYTAGGTNEHPKGSASFFLRGRSSWRNCDADPRAGNHSKISKTWFTSIASCYLAEESIMALFW